MSSYLDVGNNQGNGGVGQIYQGLNVLEEELQEKGAMFRDFLTSRVIHNSDISEG